MDCTFINSNAQSGTNLAKKCLIMLGGYLIPISTAAPVGKIPDDHEAWNQPDFDPRKHVLTGVFWPGYIKASELALQWKPYIDKNKFGASHMFHTKAAESLLSNLNMKMILSVREPRDWIYSAARKIYENPEAFGRDKSTSITQHIYDLIHGFRPTKNKIGRLSMLERYTRIKKWTSWSQVLMIKFENLIGSKGGGNDEIMLLEIEKIADHLNIKPSDEIKDTIIKNLYGGTSTFRKGKIGFWEEEKEIINEHDTLFNEAGDIFEYR